MIARAVHTARWEGRRKDVLYYGSNRPPHLVKNLPNFHWWLSHSYYFFCVVFRWLQTIPFFIPGECELNRVSHKCAVDGECQTFVAKSTVSFISWDCKDQWLWIEIYCRKQRLECITKVSLTSPMVDDSTKCTLYIPRSEYWNPPFFLSLCTPDIPELLSIQTCALTFGWLFQSIIDLLVQTL